MIKPSRSTWTHIFPFWCVLYFYPWDEMHNHLFLRQLPRLVKNSENIGCVILLVSWNRVSHPPRELCTNCAIETKAGANCIATNHSVFLFGSSACDSVMSGDSAKVCVKNMDFWYNEANVELRCLADATEPCYWTVLLKGRKAEFQKICAKITYSCPAQRGGVCSSENNHQTTMSWD